MANKQTYSLNLNVSGVIKSYRDAITQMEQAGAKANVTEGLTKSLDKLEEKFKNLANEGSLGKDNSKDIKSFQSRVDKTYSSLGLLGKAIENITKDKNNFSTAAIENFDRQLAEVQKKARELQQAFAQGFQNLGFSADLSNELTNTVKSEEDVRKTLEEELRLRQQIERSLRQAAFDAQRQAAVDATKSGSGRNILDAGNVNREWATNTMGFNRQFTTQAMNDINQQFIQAIRRGEDFQQVWENGIQNSIFDTEEQFRNFVQDIDALQARLQDVINKRDQLASKSTAVTDYENAVHNREAIGDTSGGTVNFSPAAQGLIDNTTNALQELNNASAIVTEQERLRAQAERDAEEAQERLNNTSSNLVNTTEGSKEVFDESAEAIENTAKTAEDSAAAFEQMKNRLLAFFSITSMFNMLRQQIQKTYNDVKTLDKSFASIAMVTDKSVGQMWSSYGDYADMASQLGQTTDSMIKASALFYQQGLNEKEALELTTDTMKLATLAGNDFETATQEMTSAIRGFKMEMEEGSHVTDVYSTLAANAAASVDDIAQAMARTASIANSAGMSFENTSAFLTQMIETTQESAENIGTSMKTIIARFTELKENVAGTEDSEFDDLDYNKVDKALKSVGVALKDTTGQFRNLDEVFLELSGKWDSLDRNTQRYVATIAAGSRQQSRFIAMMDNYDRTVELMDKAADSEGKADEQFAKYADTMEYKLNQLSTKWEEFRVQTLDSEFFKGALDTLNGFLDRLKNIDFKKAIAIGPAAIWAAKTFISTFLTNFKKNVGQFKALGKEIGNTINKNKPKINIQLEQQMLKKQISDSESQLMSITSKPHLLKLGLENNNAKDMVAQYKTEVEATTGVEITWAEAVNKLAQELGIETGNLNQNYEAIKKKQQEMQKTDEEYKKAIEEQKKFNIQQQKSAAVNQLTSVAISSATTALSGFISGAMSGSEALKSFALQMGLMGAQMFLSATISSVTTAIKVANAKAEEESWWAVFIAETAATMGAALLVLAITGALVVVTLLCAALIKQGEEAKKAADVTEQLANANKELEEAKAKRDTTKNELKNLEDERKTVEDIKKEYTQLSKQKVKSAEDQDRLNELYNEIKDKYPEIIKFENEQNNLLILQNDEQDQKLAKLDEEIKKKKELLSMQNVETLSAQIVADEYSGLKDIEKATGIQIDAQTEITDFKEMTSGKLKKTRNDAFNQVVTRDVSYTEVTDFGKELNSFAEKLTDGGNNFVGAGQETQNKIIDAWNYVMSGEGQVANEFKDAAEEMRNAVQEAAKAFNHFAEYYNITKETAAELYEDKSETEQVIRAAFKAQDLGKQKSFNDLKKRKDVANSKDAGEHFDWMVKQLDFTDKKEAQDLANAAENIMKAVADGAAGRENDWADVTKELSSDALMLLEKWGVTDQTSYEDFFGKANVKDKNTFRKIEKQLYNELIEVQLKDQAGYENAPEELISHVTKMQMDMSESTLDQGLEMWNKLNEQLENADVEDAASIEIKNLAGEYTEDQLNQLNERISTIYGKAAEGIKIGTADMLSAAYSAAIESTGSEQLAQKFVNDQLNVLKQNNIKEEDWAAFMQIDWSKVSDPTSFKTFRESQIQLMKEQGYSNAEQLFDEMAKYAEKHGALDIHIDTELELENFIEQLDELQDKIESIGDTVINSVKDMTENGEVSFKTFQDAIKNLSELGLNAYDYYDIDENGKITANQEKLKQLYEDQLKAGEEQLIQEKNQAILKKNAIDLQIKQIQAQIKSLERGDDLIDMEIDMNNQLQPVLATWIQIGKAIAEITGQDFDETAFTTKYVTKLDDTQRQEVIDALYDQLEPLKQSSEILNDTITKMDKEISVRDKYNAAAMRDYNQSLAEAEGKTLDVEKAQEDYNKALEDYNKQLETVTEKQESLNDKLEEYNELLYGKDNRKSSLDYLYNYDEAISSFNDEISRAKDLLSDAISIDESTSALERYAAATHNLIAEESAKQKVIQAGLNNYADMIENGSKSYRNSETGEDIAINFGDYAKLDERTGKYIIDQRLINQAQFNDDYKDLIEENVETYNKYVDEMLKSEDNVRKAEKELQDERKSALKNYTAMEKEIADALKAQYQEEVDNLKSKYDSMKEADDDYVDALQEAIEKQRKLREQENAWEDLAEKEKKLSLMQRDTSGANRTEVMDLEDEIQEDREQLLDDAIDNIIDGLSDLYESQQELRETEIELKEALLDNTIYWNTQAEGLAASFTSTEDYMEFMSQISTEFAELTLAQQQEKLNEYGDTYTAASEYMAMVAMDNMSQTGDFIVDATTVSGEEITEIVTNTAETFTDEVTRAYNETTKAFTEDLDKAEEAIADAKRELQEAIQKLNECSAAANKAAEALYYAQQASMNSEDTNKIANTAITSPSSRSLFDWIQLKDTMNGMSYAVNNGSIDSGTFSVGPNGSFTHAELANYVKKIYRSNNLEDLQSIASSIGLTTTKDNGSTPLNSYELYKKIKERMILQDNSLESVFKYRDGGLVDYTGPAWVDGTYSKPEAFLSAEDTERIGNAAKILADIPWLSRETDNASVVTNNGGDVHVEINLNIDHISSETDIDEMLERVKEEIVDVARPTGTNVILQQQL